MIRFATLFTLLSLSTHGATRDPKADGTGKDPKPDIAALVASDSVLGMSIPVGTRAREVAAHEDAGVTSPTALTFDESGVLYLTETHRFRFGVEDARDHLYWLMDDIALQTVEDRAKMFEKWREKVPLERMIERSEKVRRLSDQGNDGRYRKSEIFAEGFNDELDGTAAGVFAYEGTVFLANIPKIYALRDEDDDGKAEIRDVIAEGFGVRVSFSGHDLNGFALGPDGRIYGTIGDRGFNMNTAEGKHYKFPEQGAVFRFEPDGTQFEVIHTGLRNPKEIAFDAYGNAFTVDNNSDQKDKARIVYVVEGGDSGWRMECQTIGSFFRQIALDESPPSAWMDERMWEPANEAQPGWMLPPVANLTSGPSGLTYHPGSGFLASEVGRFLICDYRGGAAKSGVWSFEVAPEGAGMKLVDGRPLVWNVAATDVEYSWDGRVFITDFIKGWTSHEDGRVLELGAEEPFKQKEAEEAARLIAEGFAERSVEELVRLLAHADMRVRIRAQLALTKVARGLHALEKVAKEGEGFARLHAIWGLGIVARRGEMAASGLNPEEPNELSDSGLREKAIKALESLLDHDDPEVRAQSVRVLGESGVAGDRIDFAALLEDSSSRVRMFAAIGAGKTHSVGVLGAILKMLEENDDRDPYLRHAGVHAMELMVDPIQLARLRDHESRAVRMAAVIALGRLKHERVGDFVQDEDPRVSDEAVRLIHDRGIEIARHLVAALASDESGRERSPMMWRRILHSAFRLGDLENLERVVAFALDAEIPVDARNEALRLLSLWCEPPPVDQSLGRFAPLPKRPSAPIRDALQKRTGDLLALENELISRGLEVIDAHRFDLSEVPDAELEAMVFNKEIPIRGRLRALKLLKAKNPADFDELLFRLSDMENDELVIEGLSGLVERKSTNAAEALRRAFESDRVMVRQRAWQLAEGVRDPAIVERFVEALEKLADSEGEAVDALELIEAARKRKEPEIGKALEEYGARIKASLDPLAMWKSALVGGDSKRGRAVFRSQPAAQCARCHAAGHGQAGPVLDGVALRGDRRFLLESLVVPAAQVTPGYGMVAATLKDGSSIGGLLSEETPEAVVLDIAGTKKRVPRSEISVISEPISAMPPMGAVLSFTELRDLVAWLAELDEP